MRMNTIVVLGLNPPRKGIEDRSWACHSNGEADKLAKFLNDNHIPCKAMTLLEWNKKYGNRP